MTGNISAWQKPINCGATLALSAGIAALLLSAGNALACPGCVIGPMRQRYPELVYWEAIFSVWVILAVAFWLHHEFCRPDREMRIATATAVLISCTPWLFDLPLGALAGMGVLAWLVREETMRLAELGRPEPVGKGVLLGLAVSLGWSIFLWVVVGGHAVTFLASFVPTMVLAGLYLPMGRQQGRRFWRGVVLLIAILGPWISLPVNALARVGWYSGWMGSMRWPGDEEAMDCYLSTILISACIPVVVGLAAYLFRDRKRFDGLAYAGLLIGFAATAGAFAARYVRYL
jgi:hypothetical protein